MVGGTSILTASAPQTLHIRVVKISRAYAYGYLQKSVIRIQQSCDGADSGFNIGVVNHVTSDRLFKIAG